MKKGFTILELLVASMLLGMLMTILTMIFNQSSIAWRTGIAGATDMDKVRSKIAIDREEADDLYLWDDKVYKVLGLWTLDGKLRDRAWSVETVDQDDNVTRLSVSSSQDVVQPAAHLVQDDVGSASSGSSMSSYTVNVKSAGPNRVFGDYDDVWSMPDEFD